MSVELGLLQLQVKNSGYLERDTGDSGSAVKPPFKWLRYGSVHSRVCMLKLLVGLFPKELRKKKLVHGELCFLLFCLFNEVHGERSRARFHKVNWYTVRRKM